MSGAVDSDGNVDIERYATLAQRATEQALGNMRDGWDASAELSFASAAWSAVMGEADENTLADLDGFELSDGGYDRRQRECTCPPDIRARGGFRSGCPVHAA